MISVSKRNEVGHADVLLHIDPSRIREVDRSMRKRGVPSKISAPTDPLGLRLMVGAINVLAGS